MYSQTRAGQEQTKTHNEQGSKHEHEPPNTRAASESARAHPSATSVFYHSTNTLTQTLSAGRGGQQLAHEPGLRWPHDAIQANIVAPGYKGKGP